MKMRIGFLGVDGIQALDLVGPLDAFAGATIMDGQGNRVCPYETIVIGMTARPFVSESGIAFKPHETVLTAPPLDTLIIPGGVSWREGDTAARLAPWLRARATTTRRVATVCTGLFALGPTGLLDGRHVTTHWRYASDAAKRFSKLKVEADAIFLKDGGFYTSAGVTAGIDLALALIEEDLGSEEALAVARDLVVYLKRSGGQAQFSEPLKLQAHSGDLFSGLVAWMMRNLSRDLSVESLAGQVSLSPRHFSRLFRGAFGMPPADFVEHLRLDQARTLLAMPATTVDGISVAVGFASADAFRRAFSRRFGVAPSAYRSSLTPTARRCDSSIG